MVKVETLKEDGFVRIPRCGVPLNVRASKVVVLKCGWEVLAESYHEEGKSCGTKRGVFAFKVPLNVRSQNFLVFKGEYGSLKFNI